jgi:hypothetical protein
MRDRALHTEGRRRKGAETAPGERAAVARALFRGDEREVWVPPGLAKSGPESAPCTTAATATQCRSNPVSGRSLPKTGYKCPPETIGYFALRMPKIGAWRLVANSQRPAIRGPFCEYQGHFLQAPDWLAEAGGFEPSNGQLNLARMWSHHLVETGNPFSSAMGGEVGFLYSFRTFCI